MYVQRWGFKLNHRTFNTNKVNYLQISMNNWWLGMMQRGDSFASICEDPQDFLFTQTTVQVLVHQLDDVTV